MAPFGGNRGSMGPIVKNVAIAVLACVVIFLMYAYNRASGELEQLNERNVRVTRQQEVLKTQIHDLLEIRSKLEGNLQKMQADRVRCMRDTDQLKKMYVSQMESMKETLKFRISSLETENSELQSRAGSYEEKYNDMVATRKKEHDDNLIAQEACQDNVKKLEAHNAELSVQMADLQHNLDTYRLDRLRYESFRQNCSNELSLSKLRLNQLQEEMAQMSDKLKVMENVFTSGKYRQSKPSHPVAMETDKQHLPSDVDVHSVPQENNRGVPQQPQRRVTTGTLVPQVKNRDTVMENSQSLEGRVPQLRRGAPPYLPELRDNRPIGLQRPQEKPNPLAGTRYSKVEQAQPPAGPVDQLADVLHHKLSQGKQLKESEKLLYQAVNKLDTNAQPHPPQDVQNHPIEQHNLQPDTRPFMENSETHNLPALSDNLRHDNQPVVRHDNQPVDDKDGEETDSEKKTFEQDQRDEDRRLFEMFQGDEHNGQDDDNLLLEEEDKKEDGKETDDYKEDKELDQDSKEMADYKEDKEYEEKEDQKYEDDKKYDLNKDVDDYQYGNDQDKVNPNEDNLI